MARPGALNASNNIGTRLSGALDCTVLPKPARKWFWLSAGAVIIALVIWIFLPEDTEGWRPYTFDEELAALKAKRAIPDEENAAIIYNQLLDSYDPNSFGPDFLIGEVGRVVRFEPWSAKDYPEVAEWLESHETTISKLLEAAQVKDCRFPIMSDSVKLSEAMDRLAAMRRWAYLLVYAANNDLGEGRIEQAIEKGIAILRMSEHQRQQTSIVDFLVGNALEALACKQFNRIVMSSDASENYPCLIEEALSEVRFNWNSNLPRILDHEKLLANNFCGKFYAINPDGKVRFNPCVAKSCGRNVDELVITYWHERGMKVGTILCWFYMPSTPQKAKGIIDAEYERLYAMAKPDYGWQKKAEKPTKMFRLNYRYFVERLVGMLEPAYYKIHDLYLRLTADKRGSRIIIALRRYKNKNGNWPESLDDVKALAPAEIFVDAINGSSFVYKPTEENFTLYSKGKNNIDEDGKWDGWDEEKTEADDWLIWPRRSYKAKEESRDAEQQ
ncbi:MAG: hypothetical protein ACYSQZ_09125 [Planctomycetota bacterium]